MNRRDETPSSEVTRRQFLVQAGVAGFTVAMGVQWLFPGNVLAIPNAEGFLLVDLKKCQGRLIATVKKNANVLSHMMGYFKKLISSEEKKELAEVIENYRGVLIPLIVPVTLIRHYVRKHNEEYLSRQHYLNPHPLELMPRNHV
jgi:hypothetical protein